MDLKEEVLSELIERDVVEIIIVSPFLFLMHKENLQ